MQSDSSKAYENEEIETQSVSDDLSEKGENYLPQNTDRPALEPESIETVEQEQKAESAENKVPEQETVSAKTEEVTAETETDDSPDRDDPK